MSAPEIVKALNGRWHGSYGTASAAMIEKHYGKFLPSEKRRWLAQGQLELDLPETNVVNIS